MILFLLIFLIQETMENYNIAIVGKSGVGKSSLLNYLFDKDIAKTGNGKPVTYPGFHLFKNKINNKTVNIYDSWGIEAGKTQKWLNDFKEFQKDRKDEDDVSKWVHSIIYCISGNGKRIEDFDKKIIEAIKKESLKPVIVLTKSDSDGIDDFADKIYSITGIKPVKVSNVEKKTFGGMVKKFGREELIKSIEKSSVDSFKDRFKYLLNNKLVREKNKLDAVFLKSFKAYLFDCAIKEKVSRNDLTQIEKNLKLEVNESQKQFKKEIDSFISRAEMFYKNKISTVFNKNIDKSFNFNLKIPPEFDFDILDIIFPPIIIIRKFFSRIPKDDQKVYPTDKIIGIFKEKNHMK